MENASKKVHVYFQLPDGICRGVWGESLRDCAEKMKRIRETWEKGETAEYVVTRDGQKISVEQLE